MARGTTLHAQPDFGSAGNARKASVNEFPEIPQEGQTIAISVIEGLSKGLAYQMTKSCITAGRIGGGADFEFDDPEASEVHFILAAREDGARIYDGAFTTGIYVNSLRVATADLKHLSTFRVGSSVFRVTVLPNSQPVDIG